MARGARWSDAELARAVALRQQGMPVAAIAARLKRTRAAVELKLLTAGVRLAGRAARIAPRALTCPYDLRPEWMIEPARLSEWERFESAFAGVRFEDAREAPWAAPGRGAGVVGGQWGQA